VWFVGWCEPLNAGVRPAGLKDEMTTSLPPLMRDQRQVDIDHLKLLSVLHYVGSGLAIVGLLMLGAHFAFFQAVMADPDSFFRKNLDGPMPSAKLFELMRFVYLGAAIWLLGSCIINILSGQFIRKRKHRAFSLAVAGLNCLYMPLGALLGVFTIVVLIRDSVRELYKAEQADAADSR
jgi:hypothetical protein